LAILRKQKSKLWGNLLKANFPAFENGLRILHLGEMELLTNGIRDIVFSWRKSRVVIVTLLLIISSIARGQEATMNIKHRKSGKSKTLDPNRVLHVETDSSIYLGYFSIASENTLMVKMPLEGDTTHADTTVILSIADVRYIRYCKKNQYCKCEKRRQPDWGSSRINKLTIGLIAVPLSSFIIRGTPDTKAKIFWGGIVGVIGFQVFGKMFTKDKYYDLKDRWEYNGNAK